MLTVCICMCDFHKIWYEWYAIGDHPNLILLHFVQSVIRMWQMHKIVRGGGQH